MQRLSDDLLCEIILLVIRSPPTHGGATYDHAVSPLEKLSTLAMVSKGWHLMIEHTPRLWTYLSSDDPLSITTKALSLSKAASLYIKCSGVKQRWLRWDPPPTRSYLNLVKTHIKRWRVAIFLHVPDDLLQDTLQQQEAPILESLVIIKTYSYEPQNPFGGGPLPRLRYLYCKSVALPWNSGLFSGLSSLTIHHETGHVITTPDLAHILINNPLLTTLRITQRHSPPEETDPDTFPVLHRPHLKTLELDLPGSLSNFMLRHVSAPACSKFSYVVHDCWESSLEHIIPFFLSTLSANTRSGPRCRVWIIPDNDTLNLIIIYDGEPFSHSTFSLTFKCEEFARLLTWLVDRLLPSTNVELAATLLLSEVFPFEEEKELRGFLRKLPRATNVYLSDGYKPEVLFNILSATLEDGEAVNGDRFLLQGMEEMMIIELERDLDGCLRMLEERTRSAEGTLLPQVLKLRTIKSELDRDVRQRIIDFFGQGNLIEGDSDLEDDSNSELSVEY
ncbi:hypothetical protein FRC04_008498 [Tulasnella sp. 424]|nr:hypothetical protein FRC04_008498 [Tulasnella sp. 424]